MSLCAEWSTALLHGSRLENSHSSPLNGVKMVESIVSAGADSCIERSIERQELIASPSVCTKGRNN